MGRQSTNGRRGDGRAAPHDWLTSGGSIGFALPVAVGAALAAPQRRVLALVGDGSAMYTPQALWTMARESLNVTVVNFANRPYQILRGAFSGVGAGSMGQRATDMLTLDRPPRAGLGGWRAAWACRPAAWTTSNRSAVPCKLHWWRMARC